MRLLMNGGGLRGPGASKLLLVAAAVVGLGGAWPSTAAAGQHTVYIYNVRSNSGWFRTGTETYGGYRDLWTSYANCRAAITKRVNDNKRYGYDSEAFAIVLQNSYPPPGALRSYVSGVVVYIPGRGYLASAGGQETSDTAVCRLEPASTTPARAWTEPMPTPFLRRETLREREAEASA